MGYDVETLRIYDLEESDSEVPVKTAADMMADLRRKNSGPTGPISAPPPKPVVGADPQSSVAKLKELTALIKR